MSQLEDLNILNKRCGYNIHNGIRILHAEEDYSVVEAELFEGSMNPWGMVHGGLVYSLCDVATGIAAGGTKRRVVTLSGNMYYLRPSQGTRLRAEGRVVKRGKSVLIAEAFVYDDQDRMTARGTFEYFEADGK